MADPSTPLADRCPHTPSTGYAGPAGLAVVRNSVLNLLVGIVVFSCNCCCWGTRVLEKWVVSSTLAIRRDRLNSKKMDYRCPYSLLIVARGGHPSHWR
jgi:hypothetical protein